MKEGKKKWKMRGGCGKIKYDRMTEAPCEWRLLLASSLITVFLGFISISLIAHLLPIFTFNLNLFCFDIHMSHHLLLPISILHLTSYRNHFK